MNLKKIILTTALALSTTYLTAQSPVEQARQRRLQQQTEQTSTTTTPAVQTPQTQTPTPQPPKIQESRYTAKDLEQNINLGKMSIGDEIKRFSVTLDESQFTLRRDAPIHLTYEGAKLGQLKPAEDGSWLYEGSIKDLSIGPNKLTAAFENEIGLKTNAYFNITVTNEPPKPGTLSYVFKNNRTGETLEGTVEPTNARDKTLFSIGDVSANYSLQKLEMIVTDEDENVIPRSIVYSNNKILGEFKEIAENKFQYISPNAGIPQNVGVTRKGGSFKDTAGGETYWEIIFGAIGATSPVTNVTLDFEKQGTKELTPLEKTLDAYDTNKRGNRRK